ncbi:MAG: hypothetical protein F6K09_09690 [Merismopedia sp. SIO2A8]|nr:hypothetical protein [Merismopedia sp. SIO2A8]
MRTLDQQLRYEKLELLSNPTRRAPSRFNGITPFLRRVSRYAVRWLTQGHEPQIWITQTRSGQQCWHLYDPMTQQRAVVSSEEEARCWLENRYHR